VVAKPTLKRALRRQLPPDPAPALSQLVKFMDRIYPGECVKCSGSVMLAWDPVAKSNFLKCLMCGMTIFGQEVRA
jgi:hypothetical protein